MTDFFLTIYVSPLSRIRYWIAVLVITWCFFSLIFSMIRSLRITWSIMNSVACVIGLLLIFWITVLRRSPGERIIYVIPFYAFHLAKRKREMYRELLMNVFLFVPVGLTLPYAVEMTAALLAKRRDKKKDAASALDKFLTLDGRRITGRLKIIGYSILFAAIFSFCIEFLQALFALGTAEVDDVIMNTLGTAIGCCPFLVRLKGINKPWATV